METRALRYFVAAYEEQNISAAAKRCFVAQPSISTSIADLEATLGAALFIRHPRGVTPTAEGRELYDVARKVLGEMAAIKNLFAPPGKADPPLSLAVMPSIDTAQLQKILQAFIRPDRKASLRLVDLTDAFDARIVSDRMVERSESFVPLWRDRYVLAMPMGHGLSLRKSVLLKDLTDVPFIERCSCEALGEVTSALKRHKVQPAIVAQAKTEDWAAAMVASGLGCALLPLASARRHKDIHTCEIKDLTLERTVGIAHQRKTPAPKALQNFLSDLGALRHAQRTIDAA